MRQGFDYELDRLATDILTLYKPDGTVFPDIKARVSPNTIFIMDGTLLIEIGDKLVRTRPNGARDVFIVDDPGYRSPVLEFPAHFQARVHLVRNDSGLVPEAHGPQRAVEPQNHECAKAKPGPKTDRVTALRVLEIVTRVAGSDRWQSRLDDVCEALDEAKIPRPKRWLKREPPLRSWTDAAMEEPELAKKAIAHHLKVARV